MMHDMMGNGMGWMMTGMGLLWVLVIIVLVLAAAALVKYLVSGRGGSK
jgi:type IV secretory pathway VirB2 component (pilin)